MTIYQAHNFVVHACIYRASDEKHEVISAFLTVTINEVNDNAPKFEDPDPTVEILENKQAGKIFVTNIITYVLKIDR
jgi:hypothetical protein